jgi:PAS domain S-box-containing protein
MSAAIFNREQERVARLQKHLKGHIEQAQSDEYPGVAVHTKSILIDANPQAAEMFGYTINEIIGLNAWLLFPPESVEALTKHLMTQSEEAYQVVAKRKDGSRFKLELKGKDAVVAGEPIRTVLMKEVTE